MRMRNCLIFILVTLTVPAVFAAGAGDGLDDNPYNNYPYGTWKADYAAQDGGSSTYDPSDEDADVVEKPLGSTLEHWGGNIRVNLPGGDGIPPGEITYLPSFGVDDYGDKDNTYNRIWMDNVQVFPRQQVISVSGTVNDELMILICDASNPDNWDTSSCWVEWEGRGRLETSPAAIQANIFKHFEADSSDSEFDFDFDFEETDSISDNWKQWHDWRVVFAEHEGSQDLFFDSPSGTSQFHAVNYGGSLSEITSVEEGDLCADGIDNDGDWEGDTPATWYDESHDSFNFGTAGYTAGSFRDGIPDFGEEGVDCFDLSCDGSPGPAQGENTGQCNHEEETNCEDGYDNDWDGKTDAEDDDCGDSEESSSGDCIPGKLNDDGAFCGLWDAEGIAVLPGQEGKYTLLDPLSFVENTWLFSHEMSYVKQGESGEEESSWQSCNDWADSSLNYTCISTGPSS